MLISDRSAPTLRCHTATRVDKVWVGVNERQVLACNIPFQTDLQYFREVATSSLSLPTRLALCVCWCTPNSPAAPIGPEPASPKGADKSFSDRAVVHNTRPGHRSWVGIHKTQHAVLRPIGIWPPWGFGLEK